MTVDSIRVVLGRLQDDPDAPGAWDELANILTAPGQAPGTEVHRLLELARARFEQRREWAAVARMLQLELGLSAGQPEEPSMQAELARIHDEELCDAGAARDAYARLADVASGKNDALASRATEWLAEDAAKAKKWEDLYDRYLAESEGVTDPAFQAGFLVSAADVARRYAQGKVEASVVADLVERAVSLDPRARRGLVLAEVVLRGQDARLAKLLAMVLDRGSAKDDRVTAGLKAARLFDRLGAPAQATSACEKVLDLLPGQPDALSYLAEAYTRDEAWDHLVALYEDQLRAGVRPDAELGLTLQIAMVHYRMRGKPDAAEPHFERVRRADPTHAGMLNFFRELHAARGETAKLVAVLTDAQRATQDPAQKKELAAEIAQLAESQDNAAKAIEQYKALLRADPNDASARDALKRLYAQAGNHAALVDLLKQELDRLPADDKAARAAVLREMAQIHRDRHRNEQSLVQVLGQLVQLDETDIAALRELVRLYESLGRFRDLLSSQQKLAELTTDLSERAELYRASARRWAEQFSNVQNAISAYEGLLAVDPRDAEARTKLRELYAKRRAWDKLYALSELELDGTEGQARIELLGDMAKLAAERLDRGADAIALQKQILELDPHNGPVYDALEKQAEREKDFATLAEVLEQRAGSTSDPAQQLAIYQKLGAVFSDRLKDPAGATRVWRKVLELSPGQAKALRVLRESYVAAGDLDALEELYGSQNDWEGLADYLSSSADKAAEAELKISMSFRAAAVFEDKIGAPDRAARSYERVLAADPGNARAATALVPIYEREERWARLPALYEVLLSVAEDPRERAGMLRKLAEVVGQPLADRAGALAHARRAYELWPDADGLDLLESWARAAGDFGPFVEAVAARLAAGGSGGAASPAPAKKGKKKKKKGESGEAEAEATPTSADEAAAPGGLEASEERMLRLKLADAYARELGKLDEAVLEYRRLVEADPSDSDTMRAMDALLRGAERLDDLRWLFQLRVEHAPEAERAGIYEEWATLEEDVFGHAAEATRLYQKAVELDATRTETLRSLARLLLAAGDHAGAAGVIEKHRDLVVGDERAQREVELAGLYAERLARPVDALEACERALETRPRDADAVSILAKLVDEEATRARAAALLARSYGDLGDARREAQMLRVMIESEEDADRRLELHVALADAEEKKLGAPGAAFDVVLRALNERPDELSLWDRAAQLSVTAGRPTDLAEAYRAHVLSIDPALKELTRGTELELCDRAATLHDEQLGDPDGALPYLKRVLAIDPDSVPAFERLKQILSAAERWGELEELFDTAAQRAEDPGTKIALLTEVALVAEEVIGIPEKAIRYHERVLEIDPLHVPSLDGLEKLYEDAERYGDLAALLERRLETAVDEEAIDIRLYLGRLYLEQLLVPERALSHVEEILRSKPEDPDARELAERLLEIGSLKERTAVLLEGVYESRDEPRQLVRVLEVRLEFAKEDDDKRALLSRIAEIRDERLKDDAGAFGALAQLLPLVPEEEGTRERFLDIGRRLGEHARVADALTAAAEASGDKAARATLLMEVASLAEGPLADAARAEATYRKVLSIDPDDAAIVGPAAAALARIQSSQGRHDALAETLEAQARLEDSPEARKEILERLGELYETSLGQRDKAIEAWKSRLADDSADEGALAALERLFEAEGRHRELVDTLRRREEVSDDGAERERAMVKAATVLAGPVGDVNEAISAWRGVIDAFGASRKAHEALAALYAKAERHQDLAEILEADLAIVDDAAERRVLLVKLGDVRRGELADADGALEAYRQALELDANDAPARAALEAMLESPEARASAAELLLPLYELDGAHEKLLKVLEIEADVADVPAEKIEKLERALQTAEGPLSDLGRAYDYARRIVREALADEGLAAQVTTLERLTEATKRHADTAALYEEIVGEVVDGDVQLAMLRRLGELSRDHLSKPDEAIGFYRRALEVVPDDRASLAALEAIYDQKSDPSSLLEILQKRAEAAESDDERKALLYRQAELSRTKLEDVPGAIATLESLLDIEVEERATTELEALYLGAGRHQDAVGLYERMLDSLPPRSSASAASASADLRVKIARIARNQLGDAARAFDELAEALSVSPAHQATIDELEAILGATTDAEDAPTLDDRARAAEMLEPIYLKRAAWKDVERATQARLAASQDPGQRIELFQRLATLYEEQLEDYGAALDTMAKVLHEDVADEGVWAELERLARVASAEGRLAKIFATELALVEHDDERSARLARRTGELFAQNGAVADALTWYRRAYAFEPDSREIFEAIDGLLVKEGRDEERVAHLRGALDYRDGADRLALLHTIAELEETKLDRAEDATATYQAALDVDPADVRAQDRLAALFEKLGRHRDLADLLERRAGQAERPEDAAPHRLRLAKLLVERLDDPSGAITQLESIVGELPRHDAAIKELEALTKLDEHRDRVAEILRPLYEQSDAWQSVIRLDEQKLATEEDPRERAVILREMAELWDTRGEDPKKAFGAMRQAFEADPEDEGTRRELERLAARIGAFGEVAGSIEGALARDGETRVEEPFARRELLKALARVHDEELDDPRSALAAMERLAAIDPSDPEPLDAMDELAVLLGDWPRVVQIAEKRAESASDAEAASLFVRAARVREEMLDDLSGAAETYERALGLEPDDTGTIDRLISLSEVRLDAGQGEPRRLAELYTRRVELADPAASDIRYDLQIRAAKLYEEKLASPSDAIAALGLALEARPGDLAALGGLERLFRAEERWPDLLENLKEQAAIAPEVDQRADLRVRIGDLMRAQLESPGEALEQYRMVLAESPAHDAAIAALRAIAEANEDLRLDATNALLPVLRDAGRHADLVAVLELRAGALPDPESKAQALEEMGDVLSGPLENASDALGATLRALDETPDVAALHEKAERLAGRIGEAAAEGDLEAKRAGWLRYADALSARAAAVLDAVVQKSLWVRAATIAERDLGDDARAATALGKALEQGGDDLEVLLSLDRLYERLGRHRELVDVLERRLPMSSNEEQAELHHRIAKTHIEAFRDPVVGLGALRAALECVPTHAGTRATLESLTADRTLFEEVSETLEKLYRSASDHGALARLFEQRIGHASSASDRIRMRLDLAKVFEEQANEPNAALDALLVALDDDAGDSDVLAEIERLGAITGGWERASQGLEKAIAKHADLPAETASQLWVRVAAWRRDKLNDTVGAERDFEKALELDKHNEVLLRSIEQIQRTPGRERDLVGTLRRLAAIDGISGAPELRREAKAIAEGQVGDPELAEAVLREMIQVDEADAWALAELTTLRRKAGDAKQVFQLLVRRTELAQDPDAARALRHEAAEVARHDQKDVEAAVDLYEQIFEESPADVRASTALRELYAETGKKKELLGLLKRLCDVADGADARAALRLEAAKVSDELGGASDAIDLLQAILEEQPTHRDAALELSRLLEKAGRDDDLAKLLAKQLELAKERGDVEAELGYRIRLGEVQEGRLGDLDQAVATYLAVIERDAGHRLALESLARLYERKGQKADAARHLERLLADTKGDEAVAIAKRLASLFEQVGDDEGVRRALEGGLAHAERDGEIRTRLKALYERLKAWAELSRLIVGDARATEEPGARVGLLRQAAEILASRLEDHAAAADLLKEASDLVPGDRDLLLALCDAYSASGRGAQAVEVLQKIVESYGGRRSKEVATIHHRLAKAYLADGERQKALAELDTAFKIDPGSVGVLRDLGVLALDLADAEPDQKDAYVDRAGKSFKALLLQKLDESAPISKAEVFYYLGDVAHRQADDKRAIQMLERALDNDKGLERAKDLLAKLKG